MGSFLHCGLNSSFISLKHLALLDCVARIGRAMHFTCPRLKLGNSDGFWAPKLEHAVQAMNGNGSFDRTTPIRP
jgi:hypothetical protein